MSYLPSLKCLFLFLLQQLLSFPLAHLSSVCLLTQLLPYRAQRFITTLVWAVTALPDFCLLKKKKERKKNPCHPSFMTAWISDKLRFIMCIQWRPPGYVPWMSITNHRGEESKQAVSFFYLENIIFIIIEEYNKQNQINTLHGQNSSWGQKSLRGQHGSPWEAWVLCPLCPVWVDPGDSRVTQGPPGSLHLLTLDLLLSFPLFPTKAKKQKVKELGHLFGIEKDGWVEGKLSFFLVS